MEFIARLAATHPRLAEHLIELARYDRGDAFVSIEVNHEKEF